MNAVIGRDSVLQKCADLLYDESRFSSGVPSAVYYPESTEDVREVVRRAARDRVPITPAGGQTGITGGSVPIEGCALVSFSSMGRVLRFAHETGRSSPVLDCQSGVTLEAIDSLLRGPEADASPAAWPGAPAPGAWFYPPDPTEMTAQLGGTVATNASGARSFMFGPTRNHVESLRIVLANGDTLSLRRGEYAFSGGGCSFTTDQGTRFHLPAPRYASPRIKNAAGLYAADGMDLVDLFIGSEGVLGMFTEIGVRLSPAAAFTAGLSFFDTRDNAFSFASFVRGEAGAAAIEYFDATALRLLEEHREEIRPPLPGMPPGAGAAVYWETLETNGNGLEERMERWEEELARRGSSLDATWSGFDRKEMERLRAFRHAVPELVNHRVARFRQASPGIRKIGSDAAVPAAAFESFFDAVRTQLENSGIETVIFGHLGDCHLHFNMVPHDSGELERALEIYERIMDDAVAAGGTVSAEHGIGKLKIPYLSRMYPPEAVEDMKNTKRVLDPMGIMNRGTLLA